MNGDFGFLPLRFLLLLFVFGISYQEQLAKDMRFKTYNGQLIPLVGLGTYDIKGKVLVKEVLDKALAAGYRLIDTATIYENEEDIGLALKELLPKHNLSRKDIFITSKLASYDQGEKAYEALKKSLKRLNVDYIDLYLIHSPEAHGVPPSSKENSIRRAKSWELLVKAQKEGLVKNIGVSNYNVRHIKELLANNFGVKPVVNQVLWHPYYHQNELKEFCDKNGILLQAYSSLGGTGNTELITNEKVLQIAKKLGKSPAQILLRWSLQQNIAVIPKARSQKHLQDNIDLNFNIPEEDMRILNNFRQQDYWDSDTVV